MVIAVTSNLFVSYWCGVELCKAVDCHLAGTLNILLVPIQGEMWAVPGSDTKLDFPTPELVMANWGKWFPDLPDSTKRGVELLYGGGLYTQERRIQHTMMHYKSFERLFVARCGPSISRHIELQKLVAAGGTTMAEELEGLVMQIDEANAIQLQRANGDAEKATSFEIKLPGQGDGGDDDDGSLEQRLGISGEYGSGAEEMNGVVVAEVVNGHKLKTHSLDEFEAQLHTLRAEASLLGSSNMKLSGALEAWMTLEDTDSNISVGEVYEGLQPMFKTFGKVTNCFVGLFQINGSFAVTMPNVPWPPLFEDIAKVFGVLNLDFFDPDAVSMWTGRTLHYGNVTIGVAVGFVVLVGSIPAWHRLLLARWVKRNGGDDAKTWAADLGDRVVRAMMVVTALLYPVVAAQLLMLYRGVRFNDEHVLEADVRLTMEQAVPWQMMGAPFVVAIVLGVPVFFFFLLRSVARPEALAHLKPRQAAQLERRYLLRYGQLYQLYKHDCWWWELVEISRKLLLIGVLGHLQPGSLGQMWFAITVSLSAILALTYFSPYLDRKVDAAAWATQTATLLTLLAAVALRGAEDPECHCDGFRTMIEVAVPIVNVLPLTMIFYLLWATVQDIRKSFALKRPAKDAPAAMKDPEPSAEEIAATQNALKAEASPPSAEKGGKPGAGGDGGGGGGGGGDGLSADDAQLLRGVGLKVGALVEHPRFGRGAVSKVGYGRGSLVGSLVGSVASRQRELKVYATFAHQSGRSHTVGFNQKAWAKMTVLDVRASGAPVHPTADTPSAARGAAAPTRSVELVKTPLGFGVDFGDSTVVEAVKPDSQAARAGVAVGERVATVNGAAVATSAELQAALEAAGVGSTVVLGLASADGGGAGGASSSSSSSSEGGLVVLESRFYVRRTRSMMFKAATVRLVGTAGAGGEPWSALELDEAVGSSGEAATATVRVPYAAVSAVRVVDGVSERFQFDVDYVHERTRRASSRAGGGDGGGVAVPRAAMMQLRANTAAEFERWRLAFGPKLVKNVPRGRSFRAGGGVRSGASLGGEAAGQQPQHQHQHQQQQQRAAAGSSSEAINRAKEWLDEHERAQQVGASSDEEGVTVIGVSRV